MTVTALTPAGVTERSSEATATPTPAKGTDVAATTTSTTQKDGWLTSPDSARRRTTADSGRSDAFVTAARTPATGSPSAGTFETATPSPTARLSGPSSGSFEAATPSPTVRLSGPSSGSFEAATPSPTARLSGAGAATFEDTSALSRASGAGAADATFDAPSVNQLALGVSAAASTDLLSQLDGLIDAFDIAQSTAQQLDSDIAAELATLGNALTSAQKDAFLASYRPDQEQAALALADSSDTLAGALHSLLEGSPDAYKSPDAARKIFDAFECLAQSPAHAAEVFAWTRTLQGDVGDAFSQALGPGYASRLKDVVSTAVGNVAKMAFVEANGDVSVAAKKFCGTLDKLTDVKELSDLQDVPGMLEEADAVANDDSVDPVQYIKDHWASLSDVGQSIAGTTLGFFLARAGTDALKGDLKSAVLDLAQAGGPNISRVATELLTQGVGGGLANAAPGLGIATQLLALTIHRVGDLEDGTSGSGLSAMGAAASASFSAALQFGRDSIFGKALDAVGSALPSVGQLVSSLPNFGKLLSEGTKRIASLPGLGDIGYLFGSAVSAGLRLDELRLSAEDLQVAAGQARFAAFGEELRQLMKQQAEEREHRRTERAMAEAADRAREMLLEVAMRKKTEEQKKGE